MLDMVGWRLAASSCDEAYTVGRGSNSGGTAPRRIIRYRRFHRTYSQVLYSLVYKQSGLDGDAAGIL